MRSPNPEYVSIALLVENLQNSSRPMSRWAATSLDEIYLRNEFSLVRFKGSSDMNLKHTPRAIRIVALQEGSFAGLGLILERSSRPAIRSLGRELRSEIAGLPNVGLVNYQTQQQVTPMLLKEAKQTIAALEIGTSIQDGSRIVQVLYPKLLRALVRTIFGSIGVNLDELREREAASAIAIQYLKSVPFSSSEPRILIPENLEEL